MWMWKKIIMKKRNMTMFGKYVHSLLNQVYMHKSNACVTFSIPLFNPLWQRKDWEALIVAHSDGKLFQPKKKKKSKSKVAPVKWWLAPMGLVQEIISPMGIPCVIYAPNYMDTVKDTNTRISCYRDMQMYVCRRNSRRWYYTIMYTHCM